MGCPQVYGVHHMVGKQMTSLHGFEFSSVKLFVDKLCMGLVFFIIMNQKCYITAVCWARQHV